MKGLFHQSGKGCLSLVSMFYDNSTQIHASLESVPFRTLYVCSNQDRQTEGSAILATFVTRQLQL